MNDEINTGGLAFPDPARAGGHCMEVGMSLRDYFSGQALPGVIRQCAVDGLLDGESRERMFARKAYAVADAMLTKREESGESSLEKMKRERDTALRLLSDTVCYGCDQRIGSEVPRSHFCVSCRAKREAVAALGSGEAI